MRVLRLLVPMLYVLSSLPVQASYHYCLGRVKQISFYEVNNPSCVCLATEDLGDCCATEHTVLDFQDDHTQGAKTVVETLFMAIQAPVFGHVMPNRYERAETGHLLRAPPPSNQIKRIFLANSNFRL